MSTPIRPRPLSPQTVQQQQSRLASVGLLLVVLGPLAMLGGAICAGLAQADRSRRVFGGLALVGLICLGVLAIQSATIWAELIGLARAAHPLLALIQPTDGVTLPMDQILPLLATLWPGVLGLWLRALLAAPLIGLYLSATRVKTVEDLERERLVRIETQARREAQQAATRSERAPASAGGHLVLGVPVGGDLDWMTHGWFTYPAAQLGRHLVLIGASNTGKTETSKRLAYGAASVYGWRVFYLDCKGDRTTADEVLAAMQAAGHTPRACFPDAAYNGWRGDSTAILNRLLAVLDYTEPYYRDMTKLLLSLAVDAPPGPPRSSSELLERLNLDTLLAIYRGRPEARELAGIRKEDAQAAYNRYRSFFRALRGGLDGSWAFEDMRAGYILLKGLELRDQTASLGRYLLEDFAHYVAARKPLNERVLLIIDEFPAIAFGGANAATLFEMVRFRGAGVVVTAQSYAGMGADADRILGAASGLIVHQCADPERLLMRAGRRVNFQRRVGFVERGMGAGAREYAVGEGTLAASAEAKVDADLVKALGPGECVVIAGGAAQRVKVSRVVTATLTGPEVTGVAVEPIPATVSLSDLVVPLSGRGRTRDSVCVQATSATGQVLHSGASFQARRADEAEPDEAGGGPPEIIEY